MMIFSSFTWIGRLVGTLKKMKYLEVVAAVLALHKYLRKDLIDLQDTRSSKGGLLPYCTNSNQQMTSCLY